MSKPEISIVIAYHQEGQGFLEEAVNQIKDTIDVSSYEIIAVDDFSQTPLQPIDGVKILRQDSNLGVGQALRRGIWEAQSDNVWFQGADIRFIKNEWASKMIAEVKEHPKSLIATVCVGLNNESPEGMDLNVRRHRSRRQAANILIFHDHLSHPKKPSNFKNILEAQWRSIERNPQEDSWEVPCVLGASYIASKKWLQYIDIWWGHRSWGTLEPYCSLASWLMGGSCRILNTAETGHIFKRQGTHGTPHSHLTYNKLLVATLLFSDKDAKRLIDFLGNNTQVSHAKRIFEQEKKLILAKRDEYRKKIVVDVAEWCKRWNTDFRQ